MAEEIDQLTDIEAAEIVAEEIAEEIVYLELGSLKVIEEEIERSGTVPNIDFGDIKEVVLWFRVNDIGIMHLWFVMQ